MAKKFHILRQKVYFFYLFNRYIIPGKFIPCLYQNALNTNQVIYEDLFITGIIAQNCGFKVMTNENKNQWKTFLPNINFWFKNGFRGKI